MRVRLEAAVTDGVLRVEVWNTGSLASGAPDGRAPNAGIGVRNVRERLVRLFPGRHRFDLTDEKGWVRAVVELPAHVGRASSARTSQA